MSWNLEGYQVLMLKTRTVVDPGFLLTNFHLGRMQYRKK